MGTDMILKVGRWHQLLLTDIMYIDVGKRSKAWKRDDLAAVPEALCLSLLTPAGALDLQAESPRARDALVDCLWQVLEKPHAQLWRDRYRGL